MTRENLWQKIVFLEEQFDEDKKYELREIALEQIPLVDGFRDPKEYYQQYVQELSKEFNRVQEDEG